MLPLVLTATTTVSAFNPPTPDLHLRWLLFAVLSAAVAGLAWTQARNGYSHRLVWGLVAVAGIVGVLAFMQAWLTRLFSPLIGVVGQGGVVLIVLAAIAYALSSQRR